jgi:hypothetical protein
MIHTKGPVGASDLIEVSIKYVGKSECRTSSGWPVSPTVRAMTISPAVLGGATPKDGLAPEPMTLTRAMIGYTHPPSVPATTVDRLACPTCGHRPFSPRDLHQHRQDLREQWLYPDPDHHGQVLQRRHCAACQPHERVSALACASCGDGPLLAGGLAERVRDERIPPEPVRRWLDEHGWREDTRLGLVCASHRNGTDSQHSVMR